MNAYLETVMRKAQAARATPEHEPRKCACCGESGEYDLFRVVFDGAHMDTLVRHFGGEPCTDCADRFRACEGCGEIGDRHTEINADALCERCEAAVLAASRVVRVLR